MKKKIVIAIAAVVGIGLVAAGIHFGKRHFRAPPKVVGKLEVLTHAPQGKNIPITADGVTVMFNKAIVPLTTLDAGREKAVPLAISPSVAGRFFWLGTHGFIFRPNEPLTPATAYRVEMPAGLVSVDGYRLDAPLAWEFSTVTPRVLSISPRDGGTLLPRQAALFIRFNLMMDASDVEGQLRITDEKTGEAVRASRKFIWGDDGHTLLIQFTEALPWSSSVKFELPAGVKAKRGELGMAEPVVASFETPDQEASVESVVNVDYDAASEGGDSEKALKPGKQESVRAGTGICYAFSQAITKKSFERALRIAPEKGAALAPKKTAPPVYYYFTDYDSATVVGDKGKLKTLEGNRRGCATFLEEYDRGYTFSIDPKKIETLSGAALAGGGEGYQVRTRHADPALRALVTKNILSLRAPMRIPYRAMNLRALRLRLYRIADQAKYDETIKDESVFELEEKTTPPVSAGLGSSNLKLPIDRATMTIDQARMPADVVHEVPVEATADVSTRVAVDLTHLPQPLVPGIYLLEAIGEGAMPQRKGASLRAVYSMMQVTPVALAIKREVDHVLVWATDIESGQPAANLPVKVAFRQWDSDAGAWNAKGEAAGTTNEQGIAVVATPRLDEFTVCAEALPPEMASFSCEDAHRITDGRWALGRGRHHYAYVYTDRPIYRPGQKVFFSSFVREVREGRYFLPDAKTPAIVTIRDASGQEIFKREDTSLELGGVVSGSFDLSDAEDIPRGPYTLEIEVGGQDFSRTFTVASYRKPSFKVELATPTPEVSSGQEFQVDVQGKYFFGAPMRKAKAEWSIMTSTYAFSPEGFEAFSFVDEDLLHQRGADEDGEIDYESDFEFDIVASSGGGVTYAEDRDQRDNPRGPSAGGGAGDFFEDAAQGEMLMLPARLDDEGKLAIRYRPDLKKYPTSQTLTIEAGVTDPAQQQVSAAEDVIVHKADVYLGLKPERWSYGAGDTAKVAAVSLDTKGKPAAKTPFAVDIVRREYKFIEQRTADGGWRIDFAPQDTKVETQTVTTDGEGRATIPFKIPKGGEYRFIAKGKDGRGNAMQSATNVFAWGEGYVPWRMDRPEALDLVPDKESYKVGEMAKILVKSLVPVTKALVTYERGRLLDSRVIDLGGNATHIEVPITEGMIPNLFVSVVAHAGRDAARPPLLFSGETELRIEPERKRLTVAVSTDRTGAGEAPPIYRPGENVTVRIRTTDPSGAPRKAHVMVSVADESVLKLLNYQLPDLVKKFYYRRPNSVITASSLRSLKAGDAGVGAGKKRRVFKDTAHFVANLATDEKGEASFTFALPDDLTTWVIEALAATEPKTFKAFEEERKKAAAGRPAGQEALGTNLALSDRNVVGGARARIMTTLPVVMRSALPRFAAWGDAVQGKIVLNNRNPVPAEGALTVAVSGGGRLADGATKKIPYQLPAGGEGAYPFDFTIVASPDAGRAIVAAEAKDKQGVVQDSLETGFPVSDRYAPEAVATSGMTREGEREAIDLPPDIVRDRGGIDVAFRASLALAAAPSLKSLISFPWGCSEQKSATLLALLLARDLTRRLGEASFDAMVPLSDAELKKLKGMEEKMAYLDERARALVEELLSKFQHYDGGIRYWPEDRRADFFPSVQVLWALMVAREAGFAVDASALQKLRAYVRSQINLTGQGALGWDHKAYGLFALSLEEKPEAGLGDGFSAHAGEMSISGLAYFVMAAKKLGFDGTEAAGRLVGFAQQAPRHTSWPASPFFWSGAAKNTALAGAALLARDSQDPMIARALAFLVNRKKAAPCNCTQDNLYISWFISQYAKAAREEDAHFTAAIAAGKKTFAEASFDRGDFLSEKKSRIPMSDIASLKMPIDLAVEKKGEGVLYYDMLLKYYLPPDKTPTREEGIIVSREYYALSDQKEERPLTAFAAGENYKGHITIVAPKQLNYVVVQDLLPAGLEPIDMTLATSSRAAALAASAHSSHEGQGGLGGVRYGGYDDVIAEEDYGTDWGFSHQEVRDDSIVWSDAIVPAGVYHIRYPVRATTPGTYLMPGATAFEFYEPEVFGRSRARVANVK